MMTGRPRRSSSRLTPMALADAWIRRRADPQPTALADVGGLTPAVLVTGGSEGIGFSIAERFADMAEALVLVGRRSDVLEQAAGRISRDKGIAVIAVACDVTSESASEHIERTARAAGLYIDVLVNNAGMGLAGRFLERTRGEGDALLALNVAAATRLMHYFLPGMLARGRGGVMNVASLGGWSPGPYQAAYYASKAYLISLTKAVAWEERGRGVRIMVVNPGPVDTRFHARMGAEQSPYRLLVPAASPEAVARAAVRGYRLGLGVVHPGLLTPVGALLMRLTPHILLVPFVGWLLQPWRPNR